MSPPPASPTLAAAATPGWPYRLAWVVLAGVAWGLLVTAATLRPETQGLGTHRQLGLPPCTIRVLWGVRCPACGMTTSWAHVTHGQFGESIATNAGGFLLAWVSFASGGLFAFCGWSGRWLPRWAVPAWATSLIAVIVISLVEWTLRLYGAP